MRKNINSILIISTAFSIILIAFRIFYSSEITFLFLVWNLFLAWIPYFISLFFIKLNDKYKSRLSLFATLCIWFPFFPNAPYILTDLFHLWEKPGIPLWFDLILILSFAWSGLLLAVFSMIEMQKQVDIIYNKLCGNLFILASLVTAGFGIYIGRYLRWNSWDLITNPFGICNDIIRIVVDPLANLSVFGLTIFLSVFLFVAYITIKKIITIPANNKFE